MPIVIEMKATEQVAPIYSAQLLTYLKSAHKHVGLLTQLQCPVSKNGIKRTVESLLRLFSASFCGLCVSAVDIEPVVTTEPQ